MARSANAVGRTARPSAAMQNIRPFVHVVLQLFPLNKKLELILISYIALAVSVVLVGLDQIIKMIVQTNLQLHESIQFIPGLINFTYVENTGAAFSSFDGQRWFLIILTGVVMLFMLYLLCFKKLKNSIMIWHVAVIFAGGVGNLIDRIVRGAVIDYIELDFINFAIFNFADCLVVVGVISLLIYLLFFDQSDLFHRKEKSQPEKAE